MANTNHRRSRREPRLAAALFAALPAIAAQSGTPLETALQYFTQTSAAAAGERLDRTRPAPVTAAARRAALDRLPPEGDVRVLDAGQRRKLAAARRILELHGREAVYEFKVIDVPQAAVALHARAAVLVSEAALDLLKDEELERSWRTRSATSISGPTTCGRGNKGTERCFRRSSCC